MHTKEGIGPLAPLIARLVAHLAPDVVVLFGSRARGQAQRSSDIDLLVIGPFLGESRLHLRRARALVAGHVPQVDLVLARAEEVERSPFLRSVIEGGVVLWQR